MKGCLGVFVGLFAVFVGGLFCLAILGAVFGQHGTVDAGTPSSTTDMMSDARYRQKAPLSTSAASRRVGNFPTGEVTEDYTRGVAHIRNLHEKIGNFTIAEVIGEGQAIRMQQQAARDRARQQAQAAAAAAREAEEANLMHGDPDCLVLDKRSLGTTSDDYVGYVKGVVVNKCDHDLSYVQVEINFYHPDGTLDNSGLANVNNLGSGDSWAFKTPETDSDSGTWRVEKITGM
jgi:hypothetical protein